MAVHTDPTKHTSPLTTNKLLTPHSPRASPENNDGRSLSEPAVVTFPCFYMAGAGFEPATFGL